MSDFANDELLATTIAEATRQREAAALLIVPGALLLALALPAAVQEVGGGERRERWVRIAATIGSVLVAVQVGVVGLGAPAASRTGADVVQFLRASSGLEAGILLLGLLAIAVAWVGVIRAVWTSGVPSWMKWAVAVAGALGALGHLYPASPGEYAASVGVAAALWVIAAHGSLEGVGRTARVAPLP